MRHRFSVPPYIWYFARDGELTAFNVDGTAWQLLSQGSAPTAEEIRTMLLNIRRSLNWSRPTMAALLEVCPGTLRSWEDGRRKPSGAARRLVHLIHLLMQKPQACRSAFDLLLWGKSESDFAEMLPKSYPTV